MGQLKAYYWLTKPGIIYGNDLSAVAGFLLASSIQKKFNLGLLLAFIVGLSLVIASSCVINNVIDRNIDKQMARTKKRALVTGKIKPRQAMFYAIVLGIIGFWLLLAFVNVITAILGAVGLIFYLVMYGYYKRRTPFGTVVGSVSGAIPITAGYTAVTGQLDGAALILFLTMVFWQMPHFYAIAMYRFKDYEEAGLPVLPVKKGMRRTKIEILVYVAAFTVSACLLTVLGYTGYIFAIVMGLTGIVWFIKGVKGFKIAKDGPWGRQMFFFSLIVLLTLSLMTSMGALLP